MEDINKNITQNTSYNDSNHNGNHTNINHVYLNITDVVSCVVVAIGLPLIIMAIYGFYSLVRKEHVAPIYIINLLISDLIQFCGIICDLATKNQDIKIRTIFSFIYFFSLIASIGFMVCVSMERYLIIAWPLWYRFRRTIKNSIVVCVMVWLFPLAFLISFYFKANFTKIIFAVSILLPLPLFIFFLVGTCKALSISRVPSDEKRRIVAILVVVLLIYIVLFLPAAIWSAVEETRSNDPFCDLVFILLRFSPLADLFLYIFSRKGAVDKLLSSLCCCSVDNDIKTSTDQQTSSMNVGGMLSVEREL